LQLGNPIADLKIGLALFRNPDIEVHEEHLEGYIDPSKDMIQVGDGTAGYFNAYSLASAINHNENSAFWAMLDQTDPTILYVFRKDGGDNNGLLACDVYDVDPESQRLKHEFVGDSNANRFVGFENVESGVWHKAGTTFTLGSTAADVWGKMKPIQTREDKGNEVWNVTLNGKDVGKDRDLWIAAAGELILPGIGLGNGFYDDIINGLDRYSFVEIQNAADGNWAGADVRTQSKAQEAIEALNYSINVKDKIRADLGALQNRLQNTMTNLEIQAENLQASESRISDVDVALEMTEFTKNNVLTQAAVGMLSQANSLSQLALSLIGR
jgi:flagellin-like hook-associated protein FlgL